MARIHLIVGTVMGTALQVAERMATSLAARGHQVRLTANFCADDWNCSVDEIVLICTSNTGMGDLPANIVPLYQMLRHQSAALVGKRYGLVNLGDSSYPNFAQAGRTLDEALADLGATRVGEPLVLDAIFESHPEQAAVEWLSRWEAML